MKKQFSPRKPPQENNKSSSPSESAQSTGCKSITSSNDVPMVEQELLLEDYIHFSKEWRKRTWWVLIGVTNQPVAQEGGIIPSPDLGQKLSRTSLKPNKDCCEVTEISNRTWIAELSGFLAYFLIISPTEAEEWIAEIDAYREQLVAKQVLKNKWQILIYDLLRLGYMILHQIAYRIRLFY